MTPKDIARENMKYARYGGIIHGVNCPKIIHKSDGALHAADDDSPYDVDGVTYCGRCHFVLAALERGKEEIR